MKEVYVLMSYLVFLKKIIVKRRDLKLIVTSVNMNSKKFSTFLGDAPIYMIPVELFKLVIIMENQPRRIMLMQQLKKQ